METNSKQCELPLRCLLKCLSFAVFKNTCCVFLKKCGLCMCFFVSFSQICPERGRILFNFQAHSAHVDEHSDDHSTEHSAHADGEPSTEHAETHSEPSEEHSTDWASVQATWPTWLMVRLVSTMQASWTKFFGSQSLWDAQNGVVLQTSQVTEPSGSHPTSAPGAHRRRLGGWAP